MASDFSGSDEDNEDPVFSSSDWIATMTAEISYMELGHSLIMRSKAYDINNKCREIRRVRKYADQFIVTQEMSKYHFVDQMSKLWPGCRDKRNDCLKI